MKVRGNQCCYDLNRLLHKVEFTNVELPASASCTSPQHCWWSAISCTSVLKRQRLSPPKTSAHSLPPWYVCGPFCSQECAHKHSSGHLCPLAAESSSTKGNTLNLTSLLLVALSADTDEYEYSKPCCCVRIYPEWDKAEGDVHRVPLALCNLLLVGG